MPTTQEAKIVGPDEMLFRQVHPRSIREGRITSLAFKPGSGDDNELSVARSSMCSAEDAFKRHQSKGLQTVGSYGVTVAEADEAGAPAHSDPEEDFPAHAVLSFNDLSNRQSERAAKLLADKAQVRGRLYSPE